MNASADERLVVMLEARISEFEKRMRQAENRGTKTYKGLRKDSRTATQGMERDMARSTRGINQSLAATSAKIGAFGKTMIAGLSVAAIAGAVRSIDEMSRSIAQVGDEARRAGVSAEAFQEWKFVAEQNRIGVDSMVDGLKELNLRADEFVMTGKGPAAEAFERLGFGAEELKRKLADPSALMLEIIGRLEQMDGAAQIRIADEIFGGTAGERFVELLDQGEAGIRRTIDRAHDLGVVMDDEMIAKADEVNRRFNEISNTVGVTLKSAVVSVAYSVGNLIDGLKEFEDRSTDNLENRVNEIIRQRTEAMERIREAESRGQGNWATEAARARLQELEEAENEIIAILQSRTERVMTGWKPDTTPWVPPEKPGSGKGKGRRSPEDFTRAIASIREETAALEAEAAILMRAAAAGGDYARQIEIAQQKSKLLAAAQRQGIEITPELTDQVDRLAEGYAQAAAEIEGAREELTEIEAAQQEMKATFEDAFTGLVTGAKSFEEALAGILSKLAEMAASNVFNDLWAMSGAGGGAGGGGGGRGLLGGAIIPGILHDGGIAGRDGYGHGRAVSPSLFANAPRYHNGGIAGLRPNEVPAILERGERVIPRGGSAPGGVVEVRLSPELIGQVLAQAESQSVRITQQGLTQYSRTAAPVRHQQINKNPRRQG